MKKNILIVDDEVSILRALDRFLSDQGYQVTLCDNSSSAQKILGEGFVDLALVDMRLGGESGIDLVKQIQRVSPQTSCIIMTGFGSIETAVDAVKAGAFHYVTKPFEFADLLNLIKKALEHKQANQENTILKKQLKARYGFDNIIGTSDEIKAVFELVKRVADTDSTILILGESGTGKELVARAIHYNSHRANRPIVPVNCAAIPEELLESELFGHVKGAFTGAISTRMGRFEMADGGTLFLDEIGDMSPKLQVKLLRVLQEKRFDPVGSNRTVEVDVRIITATNKNIEKGVREGWFREDLYYRLNVIPVQIPPLRDRPSDIPLLTKHFLEKFSEEHQVSPPQFTPESMEALAHYAWPGNIRELENLVERLVILFPGQGVMPSSLPGNLSQESGKITTRVQIPEDGISFKSVVSDFENELILKALEKTAWNKNKAASLLKLNRTTLVEKIKKRQLEKTILN